MRIPDKSLPQSPPSRTPTTPPPDLEAEKEQRQLDQEQARKYLEEDGCIPCYPAEPAFLVQTPSAQDIKARSYWEAFPTTNAGAVCTQRNDWKEFRGFQKRNRRHYLQLKTFTAFEDKVRERRRKHQLEGDVCLHPDPIQQSRLETWIEFQDYHLQIHERLEKEAQTGKENLDTARRKLEGADSSEAGLAAFNVETYEMRFASAGSQLKLHGEILLQWIEQQRMVMVAAQSTSSNDTGRHNDQINTIRKKPASHRQKKKPKAHSILSPVHPGVSKHAPRKRSPRRQKPEISREAEDVPADSGVAQISISRTPHLRKCKSRSVTPLLPFSPQKVTKTARKAPNVKQAAAINANLRAMNGLRKTEQRKYTGKTPLRQRRSTQLHPRKVYMTKSGRKSRRPEPGFISYK